jgi:hypothetical protein
VKNAYTPEVRFYSTETVDETDAAGALGNSSLRPPPSRVYI